VVASVSSDGKVRVRRALTGEAAVWSDGPLLAIGPSPALAFDYDASRIASYESVPAEVIGVVQVWDARTGQHLISLPGHRGPGQTLAFERNGTRLASGGNDHTVRVWDTSTGECLKVLHGHTSSVRCVVFSFDGSRIVS